MWSIEGQHGQHIQAPRHTGMHTTPQRQLNLFGLHDINMATHFNGTFQPCLTSVQWKPCWTLCKGKTATVGQLSIELCQGITVSQSQRPSSREKVESGTEAGAQDSSCHTRTYSQLHVAGLCHRRLCIMIAARHDNFHSCLKGKGLTWLARKPEGTERTGPMRGAMLLSRSSASLLCSVLCPPCRECMHAGAAPYVNAVQEAIQCSGNRNRASVAA